MKNRKTKNHLRTHRRKSGLSQRQVGQLLGYDNEVQVSRHESAANTPLLTSAFGYQVIFRVPVHLLFPGIYEQAKEEIEGRLRELEVHLQARTVRGPEAETIAQTLVWMMDRREKDIQTTDAA